MTIIIGTIEYARSEKPTTHEKISHLLTMNGKDVIRIAWNALHPIKCKHYTKNDGCNKGPYSANYCTQQISRKSLKKWFRQFFNLEDDNQGNACVQQLCDLDLLISFQCISEDPLFSSTKYYASYCAPKFSL